MYVYMHCKGHTLGGYRKRALRGARAEAAHDGPLTNPFSKWTIVCRLAGGGWGACCRCTSLVLLHPVSGIAGARISPR